MNLILKIQFWIIFEGQILINNEPYLKVDNSTQSLKITNLPENENSSIKIIGISTDYENNVSEEYIVHPYTGYPILKIITPDPDEENRLKTNERHRYSQQKEQKLDEILDMKLL